MIEIHSDLIRPKGILFDYWNTLVSWSPNREAGIHGLLQMIPDRKDITCEKIKKIADELMEAAGTVKKVSNMEFSRRQFDRNLFDRLGISFDISDDELDIMYIENYHHSAGEPGVIDMLEAVRQVGIKTGVVSNASANGASHSYLLDKLGIVNYFDFLMTSADYGFRKPHPEIFKTALAKLGTEANKTWFVGDSIEDDIKGAEAAGMIAFWYNPSGIKPEAGVPQNRVHSWSEFITVLKNIN